MRLRLTNLQKLRSTTFDTLILGGGINGSVAAASLATKGVQVELIDRGDFAGSTSFSSSNLVWVGIKYLENYEFLLVNKLCKSRNQLMRSYPSIVKEIRFLTTIQMGTGEMVTKLDNFLRRRSKIEQVMSRDDIIQAPGLKEACRILFGDQADEKLSEYIESDIKTIKF